MSILELKNVTKIFCADEEEVNVLDNINLKVEEGEIIAITGPSGCGKSTILNLISKLIKPTYGEIDVNGEIGYMFQKDHLFEYRTVYKNVILGLEIKKDLKKENIDEVNRMLDAYGLKDFKNSYPREL